MKVLDPGHHYTVDWYDHPFIEHFSGASIQFMKRIGENYPGNSNNHAGTNCQELIRVLIDRVKYLDDQIHSQYNTQIIDNLRIALLCFEERAASRHNRELDYREIDYNDGAIEKITTCKTCGHIQCKSHGMEAMP